MDELFNRLFGSDFLSYQYDKKKGTSVSEHIVCKLMEYNHEEWEMQFVDTISRKETPTLPKKRSACFSRARPETKKRRVIVTSSQKAGADSPIPIDDDAKIHQPVLHEGRHSELHAGMSASTTTRAELAALHPLLPPVSSQPSHLKVVHKDSYTDPFTLMQRPSESVVTKAEKLNAEAGDGGVQIFGLGDFSQDSLAVFRKFCTIAKTNGKVKSEARWLSQTDCTPDELAMLQDALWHRSPTSPILRCGRKTIDVVSFCDLIEERYVDSFLLDVCISKYLEESVAGGSGNIPTLYLPTEFYDWMGAQSKNFKCQQLAERASLLGDFNNLQQILVPVFMANHWGLIYMDLVNHHLYFDDGLMSVVPEVALPCVKEALNLILEMFPNHASLQTKFWNSFNDFSRFGMPSQRPVDSRMIGVGSCGLGVILAARDFIQNGPATINNITWRYCGMNIYRKELMLQILKWSNY